MGERVEAAGVVQELLVRETVTALLFQLTIRRKLASGSQ